MDELLKKGRMVYKKDLSIYRNNGPLPEFDSKPKVLFPPTAKMKKKVGSLLIFRQNS